MACDDASEHYRHVIYNRCFCGVLRCLGALPPRDMLSGAFSAIWNVVMKSFVKVLLWVLYENHCVIFVVNNLSFVGKIFVSFYVNSPYVFSLISVIFTDFKCFCTYHWFSPIFVSFNVISSYVSSLISVIFTDFKCFCTYHWFSPVLYEEVCDNNSLFGFYSWIMFKFEIISIGSTNIC